MYSDINNKEETSTALLLTRMSDQKDINKVSETTVNSHDNHQNELECTVHHTPSGYMDRYEWLKAITQFSNVCGASPVNNHILFFNVHDSHFDNRALTQI